MTRPLEWVLQGVLAQAATSGASPGRPGWIPGWFDGWLLLGMPVWKWLGIAIVLAAALVIAVVAQRLLLWLATRLSALTRTRWDDQLVDSGRGPLKLLLFGALVFLGTRLLRLPVPAAEGFEIAARSALIVAVAWFVLRFLRASSALVTEEVEKGQDVARARGVRTQLTVMRAIVEVAVWVVAAALLLLQFDIVRNVGVSLLASAGIAGLVLGLAAQKSIGSLLAGIQLSITQPIRIGDTVVHEGEFGTVEEITLTYVVVQAWDRRRLVIPVANFLDKPFQNWSKTTGDLLGAAIIHLDYTADVGAFRAELDRILAEEGKDLWDGQVKAIHVVDAFDRTIAIRALVSALTPGQLWDLRCLVREKLVAFAARTPGILPQQRNRLLDPGAALPAQAPAPRA